MTLPDVILSLNTDALKPLSADGMLRLNWELAHGTAVTQLNSTSVTTLGGKWSAVKRGRP